MSLSVRASLVRAPVAQRSTVVAAKPARAARLVAFSAPKKEAIQDAIKEAEETCAGGATGEW
jgi:hypothetical protein